MTERNARGDATPPPAVVLHTQTIDGFSTDGWLGTRIIAVSIGGQRVDVLGGSPIELSAGPGPSTLTVTLFVGVITMSDETVNRSCSHCGDAIYWISAPTGGWWAHEVHPEDEHDATVGV